MKYIPQKLFALAALSLACVQPVFAMTLAEAEANCAKMKGQLTVTRAAVGVNYVCKVGGKAVLSGTATTPLATTQVVPRTDLTLPSQPGTVTGQPVKPEVAPVKPGVADEKSGLTLWPLFCPDLVVSLPNPMNGSVTVRNIGTGDAKEEAELYLYCKRVGWTGLDSGCAPVSGRQWCSSYTDISGQYTGGCIYIRIPPLRPGRGHVHTLPSWSEIRWDSGSYEFSARVTYYHRTSKETNTANNTASSTLTVASRNEADLVPALNDPMDGTLIVRNDGTVAASPTRLRLQCGRRTDVNPAPAPLSSCSDVRIPPRYARDYSWGPAPYMVINIPALAPGAVWRLPQDFWGALRWTSGTYFFHAFADVDQVVPESNEWNNASNGSTMVVP